MMSSPPNATKHRSNHLPLAGTKSWQNESEDMNLIAHAKNAKKHPHHTSVRFHVIEIRAHA
jgi:hypothetical protein